MLGMSSLREPEMEIYAQVIEGMREEGQGRR